MLISLAALVLCTRPAHGGQTCQESPSDDLLVAPPLASPNQAQKLESVASSIDAPTPPLREVSDKRAALHSQPNWGQLAETQSPSPPQISPTTARKGAAETITLSAKQPIQSKHSAVLILEGGARYGVVSQVAPLPVEATQSSTTSTEVAFVGGGATLGIMPGGGAFTIAGRIRSGLFFGDSLKLATLGADLLLGATLFRSPTGRNFTYLLGGFGVEFIPSQNQDLLSLHLGGGTVLNGINLGASVDLGGNDEYAYAMLGLNLGWGKLF